MADRPSHTLPVARIALVSPDRARQIEAILLRMAQTGQLRGRVSEEQLIELLDQVCSSPTVRVLYELTVGLQIDGAQSKSAPAKGAIIVRVSPLCPFRELTTVHSFSTEREVSMMTTIGSRIVKMDHFNLYR